jgi:hypothetical protein
VSSSGRNAGSHGALRGLEASGSVHNSLIAAFHSGGESVGACGSSGPWGMQRSSGSLWLLLRSAWDADALSFERVGRVMSSGLDSNSTFGWCRGFIAALLRGAHMRSTERVRLGDGATNVGKRWSDVWPAGEVDPLSASRVGVSGCIVSYVRWNDVEDV